MPRFKLGRKPVRYDRRTLRMSSFLATIPPQPLYVDYTWARTSWGMMLNDTLGDCTAAGAAHAIQLATSLPDSRKTVTLPDSAVLDFYRKTSGYDPTRPETDQGAVCLDVLNYWRNNTYAGHPLLGYAAVDWQNDSHVRYAISQFGPLYLGFDVPETIWDKDGNVKPLWDFEDPSAPLAGGHCVIAVGYDYTMPEQPKKIMSWGGLYEMTDAFWKHYLVEAYALMLSDFVPGKSHGPEGFDKNAWNIMLKRITA